MYPCLEARMVNQVGSPAMLEGNRFLPDTGTPIWKMARSSTRLEVWLPDPLTVATWMLMSFMTCLGSGEASTSASSTWVVAINLLSKRHSERVNGRTLLVPSHLSLSCGTERLCEVLRPEDWYHSRLCGNTCQVHYTGHHVGTPLERGSPRPLGATASPISRLYQTWRRDRRQEKG